MDIPGPDTPPVRWRGLWASIADAAHGKPSAPLLQLTAIARGLAHALPRALRTPSGCLADRQRLSAPWWPRFPSHRHRGIRRFRRGRPHRAHPPRRWTCAQVAYPAATCDAGASRGATPRGTGARLGSRTSRARHRNTLTQPRRRTAQAKSHGHRSCHLPGAVGGHSPPAVDRQRPGQRSHLGRSRAA